MKVKYVNTSPFYYSITMLALLIEQFDFFTIHRCAVTLIGSGEDRRGGISILCRKIAISPEPKHSI